MRNGERTEPSEVPLAALGLERVVTYKLSRKPLAPVQQMSRANAAAYHGDIDGDFNH
jgi:hypothetical protein